MSVINRKKDSIPSSMTPAELGKAMAALDLSSVPPHKRQQAVMDHFFRIMADKIHDRSIAAEIEASRKLRFQRRTGLIIE